MKVKLLLFLQLITVPATLGEDYFDDLCQTLVNDSNPLSFRDLSNGMNKKDFQRRLHNAICSTREKIHSEDKELSNSSVEGEKMSLAWDLANYFGIHGISFLNKGRTRHP